MKNKGQAKKGTMKRLIRMLFEFYPVLLPLVLVCIILNALISSIPAVFQQNIIAVVEQYWQTKDWAAAAPTVTRLVRHPGCTVCAVSGSRLCVFLWNGDYHTGLSEEDAGKDVQPHAGFADQVF